MNPLDTNIDYAMPLKNRRQRLGLAERIYNRLMRNGLITYEKGSAEAAEKIIREEVVK